MRSIKVLFLTFLTLGVSQSLPAGVVFVDLDPGTIGIQTTATVTSGTTITAQIIYDPTAGPPPIGFTGYGVDLNWTLGGTASATTPPALLAGTIPFGTPTDGLATGTPTPAGTPLTNPGLTSAGAMNIGGGQIEDAGAIGAFTPAGPVNLAGAMFTITGAAGDTVSFTATGILPAGGSLDNGVSFGTPVIPSGAVFQDILLGTTTVPAVSMSTVTIAVPEPNAFLYLGLVGVGMVAFRKLRLRRKL